MRRLILIFIGLTFSALVFGQCIIVNPRINFPAKEVCSLDWAKILHPGRPAQLDFSSLYDYPLDQGDQGSCNAHALSEGLTYLEGAVRSGWDFRAHDSLANLSHHFSPAYIYNMLHGPKPGLDYPTALQFVVQYGCAFLSQMPYNQYDDTTKPSDNLVIGSLYYHPSDWGYTADPETARNLLYQYGAVFTTFHHASGSNHAVVLVGYDDYHDNGDNTFGAWKYANSAGRTWGDNGFGWIAYNDPWLNSSDYYYFLTDRPDHTPAFVFRFDFNLAAKPVHFTFMSASDSVTKIDLTPVLNHFFLPIEFRSDIAKADRLMIESDIDGWMPSPTDWGSLTFNDVSSWSKDNFKTLPFDTTETRILSDSLIYGPGNVSYHIFHGLTVSINLNPDSLLTPTANGILYNYPNPAHAQTTFVFSLNQDGPINLRIVSPTGQEMLSLDRSLKAGKQALPVTLNFRPGLYVAELNIAGQTITRKFVIN